MDALHPWDLTPTQAAELQRELRGALSLEWDGRRVDIVAGVDVHFEEGRPVAAIVLFEFPTLKPMAQAVASVEHRYPYIPGLLCFREGPAVLAAWDRLAERPDLVFFDSQGIAHPRGFGLASHMGLWLERPTVGVAKSRLYGDHEEPGREKGSVADLRDEADPSQVIGGVLRTRREVRPVYVSPGHRIDVQTSLELTLQVCTRYRLPEPTRWAHRVADGSDFPPGRRVRRLEE